MKKLLPLLLASLLSASAPAAPNPVVEGNNKFAFDLYSRLAKSKGNIFYSPYSVSSALAMTLAGAKGKTADQMAAVLHFPAKDGHPQFGELLKDLAKPDKGFELSIANRLWPQKSRPLFKDFQDTVQRYYLSSLEALDFSKTEPARQTINNWVAKQTHDKIKDLISTGVLSADTRLVLTNAIYFKGKWAMKFDPKSSRPELFTCGDGKQVKVPMMNQGNNFRHGSVDGMAILEMPYAGGRLAMDVLLPNNPKGLAALESKLQGDNWQRWLGSMRSKRVIVNFPRYKVTSDFRLDEKLKEMGMRDVFDEAKSDLSAIMPIPGDSRLSISAVIHKAFVEVKEEGTEAAAATAVVVMETATSVRPDPPPPVVFRADHAFLYAIRDTRSGSILFLGRCDRP